MNFAARWLWSSLSSILVLGAVGNATAQSITSHLVDELTTYRWENEDWQPATKLHYSYDQSGNQILYVHHIWRDGQWEAASRMRTQRTAQGQPKVQLSETLQDDQWVATVRHSYSYDDEGRAHTVAIDRWRDNQWNTHQKIVHAYQASDYRQQSTYFVWQDEAWQPARRMTYLANAEGYRRDLIREYWDVQQQSWERKSRQLYRYNEDYSIRETRTQMWRPTADGFDWSDAQFSAFDYDADLRRKQWTRKVLRDGVDEDWTEVLQCRQTYNAQGQPTEWLAHQMTEGEWRPSLRKEYTYRSLATQPTAVAGEPTEPLATSVLAGLDVFPNPLTTRTTLQYTLKAAGQVRIAIVDAQGQVRRTFEKAVQQPGAYSLELDATDLPNGVYYYHVQVGTTTMTKKLIVVK